MLLSTNGRKIYFDIVGPQGAPVVFFLHALAADGGMWSEQVPALLGAGYRVLRADLRGHGGSESAPGNYTMTQLVGDVVVVLDALQIQSVHFCGLSIGGMIGQGLGIAHPERVASLILCDTQSESPKDAQERWGPRVAAVQMANSLAPIAEATLGRWLSAAFKERQPVLWRQIYDTVASTSPQGYIGCAAAIQSFNFTAQLPLIKSPTPVLCGSDDPGADPDENRAIANSVQAGVFQQITGARHLPNLEMTDVFNDIIVTWCNGHR